MCIISAIANFEENMSKNSPYYNLLLKQDAPNMTSVKICEHAALCAQDTESISKICEGYQFIIAFSGHLYNTRSLYEQLSSLGYRFLDKSDAELALFSYIHFGKDCPGHLSGNFAFIIYDSMRRCLFAAADTSASIPLFYCATNGGMMISSALSKITTCPDFSPKITSECISRIICPATHIPENILSGVNTIPPGKFLEITPTRVRCCEYPKVAYQPTPTEIVRESLPLSMPPAIIYTGSKYDEQLLELLFDLGCNLRLTAYSCNFYDIFKRYSVKWQKLHLCEESVMASLEHTVAACAVPYIFPGDMVLSLALRRFTDKNQPVFTSYSSAGKNHCCAQLLINNNAFHTAVAETISPPENEEFSFNAPYLLGATAGISPISPFLRDEGGLLSPDSAKPILRRLLLYIISKDTAPIFAFFKPGALLSLYEGGFDFSGSQISETELISYIIKLNIWLEKYCPKIL